ncbi:MULTISPECIES: replication initiation and membrane attachment family protein [unclassified Bacillus (in: firmicutes)]|uniref:replication initiation and membrane attachment family protein n=1 Tax=unclassified Bacillus (in: firmicutes) TaxID=185979 RepID=UPI0008F3316F|nr:MULTISPECIES: replication initiation and membrane attachment family protein [unclassified Bacillus (in: firmicutes)]SFB17157.1 replicative DNA helicase loader DnaB [Bacillus sp. UNCCL13]SFQ77514.1 replicative DNA helicase loader DnaB [Bacillus sp. cl95]
MAQHWQEIIPIDRYTVAANGLLHEYDRKVLTFLYQPLIGAQCLSLYMTLWAEVEENRLWSESSSHHILMNLMDMNLKDIHAARLKLEGIGLLKVFMKVEEEERSFIYELQPPLDPEQFFLDGMLNIFLYKKIGKNHFARLKRFFCDQKRSTADGHKEVTRAFQDVYASATPGSLQYHSDASEDLNVKGDQTFIGRKEQKSIQVDRESFDFELLSAGLSETLLPKKALNAKVKDAISNLAFLYEIDPIQMKNILLSALNEEAEIDIEELRKAARDWYQFVHHDQLPSLIERTQPPLYQSQKKEPETQEEKLIRYFETASPLQVLKDLSGGAEPSQSDLKIIEEVMFKQKLNPGVVNVLIQYVMLKTDMKLTKGYIEKIASHWARKKVKTVKESMDLAKSNNKQYLEWANGAGTAKGQGRSNKKPIRTEMIPDWFNEDEKKTVDAPKPSDDDVEAKKKAIQEKLKSFRK